MGCSTVPVLTLITVVSNTTPTTFFCMYSLCCLQSIVDLRDSCPPSIKCFQPSPFARSEFIRGSQDLPLPLRDNRPFTHISPLTRPRTPYTTTAPLTVNTAIIPAMVRVTAFLPLASSALLPPIAANRHESYAASVHTKRDLLTCDQTYGANWTQCGNIDSTFCYNPSEGQVRTLPAVTRDRPQLTLCAVVLRTRRRILRCGQLVRTSSRILLLGQ